MIGELVGAGLSLVGGLYGGIQQRRLAKGIEAGIDDKATRNQQMHDIISNEDPTRRASAQRMLTLTEKSIRERSRRAAGAAAVMGGNDEAVAAEKAAGTQAIADAYSQVAAASDARKEREDQRYMATADAIVDERNRLAAQKAAATQQAVGGLQSAAGNIIGAV